MAPTVKWMEEKEAQTKERGDLAIIWRLSHLFGNFLCQLMPINGSGSLCTYYALLPTKQLLNTSFFHIIFKESSGGLVFW
jgi:hypothetical protein